MKGFANMITRILEDEVVFIIVVFVVYLLANCIFLSLGKYFWSRKPPKNGNPEAATGRRSVVLALFFFMAIIIFDVVVIIWLFTTGRSHISFITDFFDSLSYGNNHLT